MINDLSRVIHLILSENPDLGSLISESELFNNMQISLIDTFTNNILKQVKATFECWLDTRLCTKYFTKLISFNPQKTISDLHALCFSAQFVTG